MNMSSFHALANQEKCNLHCATNPINTIIGKVATLEGDIIRKSFNHCTVLW
jgi:hypothetical protein